ncbi:hypothetical protein [Amycolatopsis sp. NPDC059657]|uniref:hypothetical protein n=1 Tax=Amycolatopsis sp. NPDC059657 TaxID=3346899 RepID=UPI003671ABD4
MTVQAGLGEKPDEESPTRAQNDQQARGRKNPVTLDDLLGGTGEWPSFTPHEDAKPAKRKRW